MSEREGVPPTPFPGLIVKQSSHNTVIINVVKENEKEKDHQIGIVIFSFKFCYKPTNDNNIIQLRIHHRLKQ